MSNADGRSELISRTIMDKSKATDRTHLTWRRHGGIWYASGGSTPARHIRLEPESHTSSEHWKPTKPVSILDRGLFHPVPCQIEPRIFSTDKEVNVIDSNYMLMVTGSCTRVALQTLFTDMQTRTRTGMTPPHFGNEDLRMTIGLTKNVIRLTLKLLMRHNRFGMDNFVVEFD